MDLLTFQIGCLGVLILAYAAAIREPATRRRRLGELASLAAASWIAEQSCVGLYRFYAYADGWWLPVGEVPILVVSIWPMVIGSAREVVSQIWPGGHVLARALRVGALVTLDASLMEVIATSAGLWSWSEGGYLGVPLIGILGWGFFAFAASAALDLLQRRSAAWLVLAAPAATHGLLLAAWWSALRWGPRGELPAWGVALFALGSAIAVVGVWRVRRTRRLGWWTAGPRLLAAALFVALLAGATHRGATGPLWSHLGIVAAPYLLMLRWSSLRPMEAVATADADRPGDPTDG